jgi:glyoxylase-like metal-dependent hydrolase (beta-lactamase superfamily II)
MDSTGQGEWSRASAHPVAPGVHRVPLPLTNDGLRPVKVYVLAAADGLVLIDGGWAIEESRDQLAVSLSALGASVLDVRRLLVTHVHHDHYTQAVAIRRESGAIVGLGAGERPSLQLLQDDLRSPFDA